MFDNNNFSNGAQGYTSQSEYTVEYYTYLRKILHLKNDCIHGSMVTKIRRLFEIFNIVAQCEPGVNEGNEILGNEGKNEEK